MIRERPDRLQSVEAVQVLLFTGGVSCGSAVVCRRCGLPLRLCRGDLPRCVPSAMRFCCRVLCSITPAVCLLTNRTACGMLRSYTAGSRSPFVRSRDVGAVICLCGFTSGWPFVCGDLDGITGDAGNGVTEERGWRRGLYALLRKHIGLAGLSAGSTLGLRAPDCAKESSTLWTLFTLRRGYVGAYTPAVTRVHGKTRPALIYGRTGRAVYRCYQHAQASRLEPPSSGAESGCVREAVWKPHCGLILRPRPRAWCSR